MKTNAISIFLILLSLSAFTQNFCGNNNKKFKETNHFELAKLDSIIQNHRLRKSNDTVVLPLIFHILHQGEEVGSGTNVASQVIIDAVKYLNDGFAGRNEFDGSVDTKIRFALAIRDEEGYPTTGILRYDGSNNTDYLVNGWTDDVQDDFGSTNEWDTRDYINVFVVSKFESVNQTGYAYLPNWNSTNRRYGIHIAIKHSSFGTSKTMIHEGGHYLGLLHTFEGDGNNDCAPTTDCANTGDRVCDTDPHDVEASCFNPNQTNVCTGQTYGSEIFNFMSYSGRCVDIFSAGQSNRMNSAIETSSVSTLKNSEALTPFNETIAGVYTKSSFTCDNTVKFTDSSTDGPTEWSWTFEGGIPTASTEQNPEVNYLATGSFDVTLTAKNHLGSNTIILEDYITIIDENLPTVCQPTTAIIGNYGAGILEINFNGFTSKTGLVKEDLDELGQTYIDHGCAGVVPVYKDSTYELTGDYNNGTNNGNLVIYVDWNSNGQFESNEIIGKTFDTFGKQNFNITFDETETNTLCRVRVIDDLSTINGACDTRNYGQVEDFAVYIREWKAPEDEQDEEVGDSPQALLAVNSSENIFIVPNPAQNSFRINTGTDKTPKTVRIIDQYGNASLLNVLESGIVNINFLPSGIYFAQFEFDSALKTLRFVKS